MTRQVGLAALLAMAVVRSGRAQDVAGELEGWIAGDSEAPLARVEVSTSGASIPGARSAFSDNSGHFRLPGLPVGVYRVRFRLIGYRPLTYDSVSVRLASTTNLGRIQLDRQTVELPEIVVSGRTAPVDPTTTATHNVLTAEQIDQLPVDRNFRSIVSLFPQANTSFYGDEVNIAGGTGLENVYYIDGINVTDASNAATSTNLPYNFVQEIETRTAGYEAQYGRSLGGIVNVVTPNGGDEFRGQVYGFYTSTGLRTEPKLGLADLDPVSASSYDVGVSLGGPILRSRLWFYGAYNPTFDRQEIAVPGLSAREASGTQHLLAGKLTWQTDDRTALVFTIVGDPASQERVAPLVVIFGTPASVENPEVVEGKLTKGGAAVSVQGRRQIDSRLTLHASISHFSRRDDNEPRSDFGLAEPLFRDLSSGVWSGGYGGATRIRSDRDAAQLLALLDLAPHALTLGAEYEDNFAAINFQRGAGGGGGGIISRSLDQAGVPTYVWFEFYTDGRLHNRIPTVYIQDQWRVSPRLRLNAGLRWSIQRLVSPDSGLVTHIRDGIQPRAGIVYQPGELGSQKLFASFGRFAEQLPLWLAQSFGPGTVRSRRFPQDPRADTTGGVVLFELDNSSSIAEMSSAGDLLGETYDEFTLGYERRLGRRWAIGIQGIYRTLRWGIDDGLSPSDSTFHFGNPGRGSLSDTPRFQRRYAALELTLKPFASTAFPFLVSYVLSRAYGNYTGLFSTDVLAPAPNNGPQGDFPEQMQNGTGLLPNDRTHVFKFFGSHRFDPGLTAGASLTWASGTPLSEYGGIAAGAPYWSFVRQRGSVGRTPALWDLNLRLAYDLPTHWGRARPRALVDLLHVGSPRHATTYDQVHYTAIDAEGHQTGVNATYGEVTHYQPPMGARLGMTLDF